MIGVRKLGIFLLAFLFAGTVYAALPFSLESLRDIAEVQKAESREQSEKRLIEDHTRSILGLVHEWTEQDIASEKRRMASRRDSLSKGLKRVTSNYVQGLITRNHWTIFVTSICNRANQFYESGKLDGRPLLSEIRGVLDAETPLRDRIFVDGVYSA